ncbi:phospholipase A(1) DAD1, chloroplastic [Argentina anserina]|uniref:phospholipase A(1) DAD1, chloroplastic n=1 Tax=Argentina anserina TaxID=57926 RepID=UPI0021766007|nr:phospholipase A(1) DAD1, chloroplastic [Potentilla anserina]
MKLTMIKPVSATPCTQLTTPKHKSVISCCTLTQAPAKPTQQIKFTDNFPSWEQLLNPVPVDLKSPMSASTSTSNSTSTSTSTTERPSVRSVRKNWMEYQGVKNWEGLLDPLDGNLRREIIRYGNFVDASYKAFDFDPDSPTYATCKYPKSTVFENSGLPGTGYRITKNLRATSSINLPSWTERAPSWVGTQSSWIGYVAVCKDKDEIARLGRRDVVIALRGTATCLEWLENLRVTLTHLPCGTKVSHAGTHEGSVPMVESGFLSLYTSGTDQVPSLQQMIREEIGRLLQTYGNEPLSLTITGHSLGAALATLAAYDIKSTFNRAPLATVVSFGGPRVGNRSFRHNLEKKGAKVLRIVNEDDLITKVPGFVVEDKKARNVSGSPLVRMAAGFQNWIHKRVEETQWVYSEVGKELRLSSKKSPELSGNDMSTCHDLGTYLHLVENFVSNCPCKSTAKKLLSRVH